MLSNIKHTLFGTGSISKRQKNAMLSIAILLGTITVILAAVAGWVMNLVALFGAHEVTGMVIARAIGVVMFPLGMILGWF